MGRFCLLLPLLFLPSGCVTGAMLGEQHAVAVKGGHRQDDPILLNAMLPRKSKRFLSQAAVATIEVLWFPTFVVGYPAGFLFGLLAHWPETIPEAGGGELSEDGKPAPTAPVP